MPTPNKTRNKKLPSEINWLRNSKSEISHFSFFDFFKTYTKRRAQIRFLDVIKYVEDQEKQAKILNSYNKWRKTKEAANYWKQRDQANNGEANDDDVAATPNPSLTSSDTLETTETVESITLDEAKKIISKGLQINDGNTDDNYQDISISLTRFKRTVLESLSTSLLTFESHLQHLLALSNVLLIGKKSHHTDLERHFTSTTDCIRKRIYNSLKFKGTDHKFPTNIMMALISIVNCLNCGTSKIDTVTKILTLTSDNTDPIVTKLLSCVKSMIEALPFENQTEEIQEFELCTRYLQPLFQPLFDSGDDKIIFKWTNTIGLNDNLIKSRPDGCIKNFQKSIGFIEVKPIDKAKNHREINVDLHRLGIFSKEGTTQYKLKHTFAVMAIGTNVKFYLSEPVGNVLAMVELDTIRLPLSLDELPQFVPYLDRLYNVMEAIFNCCYNESNVSENCDFGVSLEPRVIKAITERSVDRTRVNCFYSYYH
ncbi:uncharacterized protein EV154DRAFT_606349 [Mucor mucedo]|uniref:uncharacterized protein n=1 Tax=Mucor mucedo TaxID=29922 RepID=UPI00221EE71E|nr:uncharacterized protein EV154DRAFT_606349 [Mucor mucedo]KAI7879855.1 hypothetical protein EV154DRAFT_606349 [Mucor mucedo]